MNKSPLDENYDEFLDTSGLNCPLPLLKTKQSLKGMECGAVLKVISTDGGSWRDIPVFVNNSVNELLSSKKTEDHYCYWIKKGDLK